MGGIDRRILVGAVIVLLITFGLGSLYGSYRERQNPSMPMVLTETGASANPETQYENADELKETVVFVAGEVEHPGIYHFSPGARVYEALEKAVPRATADLRYVEMARVMVDEETILVPAAGEAPEANSAISPASALSPRGKLNINRASAAELDQYLNGIGPTLAQRIVDYREQHGPFRKVEDIKNVSGIGEKRFADIQNQIDIK